MKHEIVIEVINVPDVIVEVERPAVTVEVVQPGLAPTSEAMPSDED